MFAHTYVVEQNRSHTCYQPQYDNVYTTPVPYDMNTRKHGIGHTQHRERAFKFASLSNTALQFCQTFGEGSSVVEENIHVRNISQSELNSRTRTYYLIGRQ